MEQNVIVFRKPSLTVFTTVAMVGDAPLLLYIVDSQPKFYWQAYILALVFVGFEYSFWLIGWHSAIRVSDDMLIVDDAFLKYSMSLSGISVRVEDELRIIAADGVRVGFDRLWWISYWKHARFSLH